MAAPTPYNRAFNFANQQAVTPAQPLNASYIEEEFNRIKRSLDSLSNNLGILQRADTALANASVGYDQLKAELNGFGFNPPTSWATATNYVERDTVFQNGKFYQCAESHVSDDFAADLAAEKWVLIADFTVATGVMVEETYDPTSVNGDAFDMDNMVEGTDTKIMTAAERAKVGYLTVTGAVDLDALAALNTIFLAGSWDASTGSFPGGGTAPAGAQYVVTTGGTVDGIVFAADDTITALTDNASTSTYSSNWYKSAGPTVVDSTTYFADNVDPTKRMQLQLAGLTTSTTRTLTVPDQDGTIAYTDETHGKHSLVIPATAMITAITNGAAWGQVEETSNKHNYVVLDFDASTDEYACFEIPMPKSWDEGTITFKAIWTTTANGTTGVAFGLQAVAVPDGDDSDVAYGTAAVVTDNAQSNPGDVLITAESGAVTIAGSPAAGELVQFRVFRDVSDANDNMTEDARLRAIRILYTTDASTDD